MKNAKIIIRKARPDEYLAVFDCITNLKDAVGRLFPAIDRELAMAHVRDTLDDANKVVLVAEQQGKIIGSISLFLKNPWWSQEVLLNSDWFIVNKDYRRSHAASMLLKVSKDIAKRLNLRFQFNMFNGFDIPRKIAFMDRKGFEIMGGSFMEKENAKSIGRR